MKIAFQSSMPHSGSTLIQNILAQHPKAYASPTSGVAEMLRASREIFTTGEAFKAQDREATIPAFRGYCNGAIKGYYSKLTDKEVVIDKSRAWISIYEWLENFIEEQPKMIVCVRHLAEVVASFENTWRTNPEQMDLAEKSVPFQTVDQRVRQWLQGPLLGGYMQGLLGSIERKKIKHMHIVRFEDIISEPELTFKRINEYLELDNFEYSFNDIKQLTREHDAVYGMYGNHKVRNKLSPPVPRRNEVLNMEINNNIISNNLWFFKSFYPELPEIK